MIYWKYIAPDLDEDGNERFSIYERDPETKRERCIRPVHTNIGGDAEWSEWDSDTIEIETTRTEYKVIEITEEEAFAEML